MQATLPYVQSRFREFNESIFGGALTEIPVQISRAKTFVGCIAYKKRRSLLGGTRYYDFRMKINGRADLPEAELEDTIIHEMIHLYIYQKGLRDTSTHGKVFREMMDGINSRFGRHITISHKGDDASFVDSRPRLRVVAVVTLKDGRTGIKVIPRKAERVAEYERGMKRTGMVSAMEFRMCTDPFFNKYPSSSALKVYFVDKEEIEAHLEGAVKLK
ncbi:MAG: SprT-like domain-containing protein [Bacteroidales bacterium]|nr:SprT-like domain-containing protein [Bacteroidales bacterium]